MNFIFTTDEQNDDVVFCSTEKDFDPMSEVDKSIESIMDEIEPA